MNQQTTVALIGTGQITRNRYIPALLANPDVDISAIVDREPRKIAELLHAHPQLEAHRPRQLSSNEQLLDLIEQGSMPPIDLPFVNIHADGREEIVLAWVTARRKPKGIATEKPFALTPGSALRMMQAAEAAGVLLAVNHQYAVYTRRLRRWFDAELVGRVTSGRTQWTRRFQKRQGPFADPALGGRPFDLAPHLLVPFLDAVGWPEIVRATPFPMTPEERRDRTHVMLESERGTLIEVDISDVFATWKERTGVRFRRGTQFELDVRLPTYHSDHMRRFRPRVTRVEHGTPTRSRIELVPPTVSEMIAQNVNDMIACVRGEQVIDQTGLTTVAQAVRVTTVCALLAAAEQRGRMVTIDELGR